MLLVIAITETGGQKLVFNKGDNFKCMSERDLSLSFHMTVGQCCNLLFAITLHSLQCCTPFFYVLYL